MKMQLRQEAHQEEVTGLTSQRKNLVAALQAKTNEHMELSNKHTLTKAAHAKALEKIERTSLLQRYAGAWRRSATKQALEKELSKTSEAAFYVSLKVQAMHAAQLEAHQARFEYEKEVWEEKLANLSAKLTETYEAELARLRSELAEERVAHNEARESGKLRGEQMQQAVMRGVLSLNTTVQEYLAPKKASPFISVTLANDAVDTAEANDSPAVAERKEEEVEGSVAVLAEQTHSVGADSVAVSVQRQFKPLPVVVGQPIKKPSKVYCPPTQQALRRAYGNERREVSILRGSARVCIERHIPEAQLEAASSTLKFTQLHPSQSKTRHGY
jgi:hypothetical protein